MVKHPCPRCGGTNGLLPISTAGVHVDVVTELDTEKELTERELYEGLDSNY